MQTTPTTSIPPAAPQAGAPVASVAAVPSSGDGASASTTQASAAPPSGQAPPPTPPPSAAASQLKLVVAKSDTSIAYSYTLVDQVTGRVVAEIPHQAAKEAAASPDYTAGGVVDTTA